MKVKETINQVLNVSHKMKDLLLSQMIQYFYTGYLNFNLKPEDIATMTWDWQQSFLDYTVKNELLVKYPVSTEFSRLFLKKIIQHLEPNQEVHDDFYTHLCSVMNNSNNSFSYRHYVIGDDLSNIITIKETRNMVVDGTTGLKTWEAALMLTDWAICNKVKFADKHILELGSGVGFTGITIGKLCKVKYILLSDCHDKVLETACENIKINFPHSIQEVANDKTCFINGNSTLGVMMLDWTEIENVCSTVVPDIVIGADIVYDPSILQPLCNVLKTFSNRNKNLDVYIASVIRNEETFNSFLDTLNTSNFTCENIDLPSSVFIKWDEKIKKSLLKIKLKY